MWVIMHVYNTEMYDQFIQCASVYKFTRQSPHTINMYTFDVLTILYESLFGLFEFLFHFRYYMHISSMEVLYYVTICVYNDDLCAKPTQCVLLNIFLNEIKVSFVPC